MKTFSKAVVLALSCSLLAIFASGDYDFESQRNQMIEEQLTRPGRGIKDPKVIAAMGKVPREEFVRATERGSAYGDHALPIGYGQTISQPFIVAFMTEQIAPREGEKILEVGTGSGYQAAILAELGASVFTIEIVEALAARAAKTLDRLGYENIEVRFGDGHQGWPEEAPFDAIIVTCAPDRIPSALTEQLREGGRMIIPVGPEGGLQKLHRIEKINGQIKNAEVLDVRFVPMTGGE